MLVASFPLCLVAAWALSFVGERIPVICVCVMIELLCLYVDTSNRRLLRDDARRAILGKVYALHCGARLEIIVQLGLLRVLVARLGVGCGGVLILRHGRLIRRLHGLPGGVRPD